MYWAPCTTARPTAPTARPMPRPTRPRNRPSPPRKPPPDFLVGAEVDVAGAGGGCWTARGESTKASSRRRTGASCAGVRAGRWGTGEASKRARPWGWNRGPYTELKASVDCARYARPTQGNFEEGRGLTLGRLFTALNGLFKRQRTTYDTPADHLPRRARFPRHHARRLCAHPPSQADGRPGRGAELGPAAR